MENKKSNGKLRRFIKVLYFLITLPIIFIVSNFLRLTQIIYHGNTNTGINDYYIGTLYVLILLLGYILFTDFLRRIISYINDGSFNGFINYFEVIRKYFIVIIIGGIIAISLILFSQNLKNECTGINEGFDEYGLCSCDKGYSKKDGICIISIEQSIINNIPEGSFIREIKKLPGQNGIYIGIYIKDFIIDKELEEGTFLSCPEEAQGQGIEGEYHIFSFKNGKITSDIKIEQWDEQYRLNFSYYNTKQNNNIFFGGKKPMDEDDGDKIEKSSLINFEDYNGDGLRNEFYLLNSWDNVCGHKNYTIIGYNIELQKIINYGIKTSNNTTTYWGDNFIPNQKGEVRNGWECGDHGGDIELKNYYKFNKNTNIFDLLNSEEKNCPEGYY